MSKFFKTISNSREPKVLRRISMVFAVGAMILGLMFLTGISKNIWVFNGAFICIGFYIILYTLSLLVSLIVAGRLLDDAYSTIRESKLFLETLKIYLDSATDSSDKINFSDISAPALLEWLESELQFGKTRTDLMEKAVNILKNHYNTIRHD